ncbi:hypothetical protein ABK040_011205 [Willaertia magna]
MIAITMENEIYIYGDNFFGQLGNEIENFKEFTKLKNKIGNIIYLDVSNTCTLIVNERKEVFISGYLKDCIMCNKFTKINILLNEDFKMLKCGMNGIFIVMKDNSCNENYDKILYLKQITKFNETNKKMINLKQILIESIGTNIENKVKTLPIIYNTLVILTENGQVFYCNLNNFITKTNICPNHLKKADFPFIVKEIASNQLSLFLLSHKNKIYKSTNLENNTITCDKKLKEKIENIYTSDNYLVCNTKFNNFLYIFNYFVKKQENNQYSLIKLDENLRGQYIYPIVLKDEIFIVTSNYKINVERNSYIIHVGFCKNLFKKVDTAELSDIIIIFCNDTVQKKRKRSVYEY